jgi:hypothetical protein
MDKKPFINQDEYDMSSFNQDLVEKVTLIRAACEIRALKYDIVPKMDVSKQIYVIEPEWNAVRTKQVIGSRMCRK